MKKILFFPAVILFFFNARSQALNTDSVRVVKVFTELLGICKNVDFADPKTISLGTFYKAAPYIVYRGEDKTRAWKDFANYANPDEKKGVDEICFKINNTINQDSSYKILKFHTEKESEGVWNIIEVSYNRKGMEKKALYAFLYIKGRFALGDID